ncbi:MAG: hypothetical protein JNL70_08250 [Saprospiraceae bacterium]|nr:hypothetical protein [Saprospiraceae bacterium]
MKMVSDSKRIITLFAFLLFVGVNYLFGQIGVSVFSYAELFHSPNESYKGQKSYQTGYNKINFSYQNYGVTINYKINKTLNANIGIQKTDRYFDCDCIDAIINRDVFYFVSSTSHRYKVAAIDKIIQIPLSLSYTFREYNKKIFHSIGFGNTLTYSLGRRNIIFDDTFSVEDRFLPSFKSFIAPDLYYNVDINMFRNLFLNLIFGFRKEPLTSSNYAVYTKVGLHFQVNH